VTDFRQVNGIDITVAPHDQAVALLTGIRGEISLVISRDECDVTPPPPPTDHGSGSSPAITWPTTPLDADTELPIIVQPPTPNYAAVESPSNLQQSPAAVVRDADAVAMDPSAAAADVEIGTAADVGEPRTTHAGASDPLPADLMDLSPPECEMMTSRDDVIISVPDAATNIDLQLRTMEALLYRDLGFDIGVDDDDADDFGLRAAAAASALSRSPISSDVKDMIQHGMLETLRLL